MLALLHRNGEISLIQIRPKEINKVANVTKHRARDGHNLKYNPVADMDVRVVESGQLQVVVVEGEGTLSVYGLKRE